MKKVLFITNYAAPYRVHFFDKLAESLDVTVLFFDRAEEKTHRSASWFEEGKGKCRFVQLSRRKNFAGRHVCVDVIDWIRKDFDEIVVCGYSKPTAQLAIAYMRLHRIPFSMEVDGGLIREENGLKRMLKQQLVGGAHTWFSSGKHTTKYLVHYGAKPDRIVEYPFSSLCREDILPEAVSAEERAALRQELGISESRMILSIGQFIPRKGFDILLRAAAQMKSDAGIYIVGGEPTEEYRKLCGELHLTNVHFCGFMTKEKLTRYYKASDLFVLPTREDIWGLVINEAMAYGLPVITTDRCVAGLELVEDGVNGYVVPVEDPAALAEKMDAVLTGDMVSMAAASLEKVRPYTIENMAMVHWNHFESGRI